MSETSQSKSKQESQKSQSGAFFVGLGILLSRIAGLVRERVFAHYFGNSDAADAFKAALKIPNFLQNLFGEGVLSASFIPVYAGLLSQSHNEQSPEKKIEASQVAMVVLSLLFLMTTFLVIIGFFLTPWFIDVVAPGFTGEKRELTIRLVQIFFPGTGLLVMSAWCLGVLNSHRKFFLSYVAPVFWNLTLIAVLIYFGHSQDQKDLAVTTAWGLVLGSLLQFLIQLPTAIKLIPIFKFSLNYKIQSVQKVIRNFIPVVVSRGVVQVSAYIDSMLASLLPSGAVSNLAYAQTLYLLPISLFGMSVSASELPELSSIVGAQSNDSAHIPTELKNQLQQRLQSGMYKMSFYVIPSAAAFLFLGQKIVALLFQSGAFTSENSREVWFVLLGSTFGLLASTLGRLYSSGFYALKNTRIPLKFAFVRVILTTVLGYLFSFPLIQFLQLPADWGTVGLTASAGLAGWVEFFLLRRSLNQLIGVTSLKLSYQLKLWFMAAAAALFSLALIPDFFKGILQICVFGAVYFILTYAWNIPESRLVIDKIRRKIRLT